MPLIRIRRLRKNLSFGAKIEGLNEETVADEGVRRQLREIFEDRGLILFENVEPSSPLQVQISKVFGPLAVQPVKALDGREPQAPPGVVEVGSDPQHSAIVEIEGQPYSGWLPWHFDDCFNSELNRGGVLRALRIAPNGGHTAFMDGIDLYRALSPQLRQQIEARAVIYSRDRRLGQLRFGRPKSFRVLQEEPLTDGVLERARVAARAIHPAVWSRQSGEKVLHVSPWMAEGMAGHADLEGDRLLEAVCQEILWLGKLRAYVHVWKTTDMLVWDNWRMLISSTGCTPPQPLSIHRTTIQGDYGLGRLEDSDQERNAACQGN
jgi:taurine dioxygenase